ncbi:hypothetical protein ZWY2020_059302 [Hordeum vulgare]|nr:hypothetical protein ZWY2020_059302 [Hordeum vulgare]
MCSTKCRLLLRRLHDRHFSTSPSHNHRKSNPQVTIRWPERSSPSPDAGDTARAHEATVRRLAAAGDVDGVQYALQEMRLRGVACSEGALVAAICAFARAGAADRALKTFYRAHDLGCAAPTVRVYNHLLDALLRENLVGAVVPVYDNMRKAGVEPNVYTYNLLMKALCQNDRVDAARKMLDEMARKGCQPDAVSHTTIVSALCKLGRVDEARRAVAETVPVCSSYNAVVHALCRQFRMRQVLSVIDEMIHRGLHPEPATYTSMVDALCKAGELRMACAILARMVTEGCAPNVQTFTVLVKGFFDAGKAHDATDMWNWMVAEGWAPTTISYNVLIRGLCHTGDLKGIICFQWHGAKRLFS